MCVVAIVCKDALFEFSAFIGSIATLPLVLGLPPLTYHTLFHDRMSAIVKLLVRGEIAFCAVICVWNVVTTLGRWRRRWDVRGVRHRLLHGTGSCRRIQNF